MLLLRRGDKLLPRLQLLRSLSAGATVETHMLQGSSAAQCRMAPLRMAVQLHLVAGGNFRGQLGNGANMDPYGPLTDAFSPVSVIGGHTFVQVSGGGLHSCGVIQAGAALCWGKRFWAAAPKSLLRPCGPFLSGI